MATAKQLAELLTRLAQHSPEAEVFIQHVRADGFAEDDLVYPVQDAGFSATEPGEPNILIVYCDAEEVP